MEHFSHQQNLAHCRRLLAEAELATSSDEIRHSMLMRLLAEEEAYGLLIFDDGDPAPNAKDDAHWTGFHSRWTNARWRVRNRLAARAFDSVCIQPLLVLEERAKQQRNLPMMISLGAWRKRTGKAQNVAPVIVEVRPAVERLV
jgi:hypothetical protein